ncbi:cysteine-rich receptor-like protein kinase [Trifolium pratense]|uniref:Cysteine-rich receptor-like protein kinase n=1 Tax=Trifolium pratense TaxID=57577 RepID=A0A2K3KWL6_TRIPR|nr:cysteine-rich receptor-like protein kinase [Trifolium pratense]
MTDCPKCYVCDLDDVTHLQFADDTLWLGAKSWADVRALRAFLVLFEKMFGLKVPFMYLGLPIGVDPRRLLFWVTGMFLGSVGKMFVR